MRIPRPAQERAARDRQSVRGGARESVKNSRQTSKRPPLDDGAITPCKVSESTGRSSEGYGLAPAERRRRTDLD